MRAMTTDGSVTSDQQTAPDVQWERRPMASWPDPNDVVEVQKEECRRLCWSSVMMISALREYTPLKFDLSTWDLHVTKPESVRIRTHLHLLIR